MIIRDQFFTISLSSIVCLFMVQPVVQVPRFQFHVSYLQSTHTGEQVTARMVQIIFFAGSCEPLISNSNGKNIYGRFENRKAGIT
jgi:hypothetical protein